MKSNPDGIKPKVYNSPGVGDLHRIEHSDGVSFKTYFLERQKDEAQVSIGVELRVTTDKGNVSLTMSRVAAMPDGMECVTAAMRLTPEAAADLVQSINMLIELPK